MSKIKEVSVIKGRAVEKEDGRLFRVIPDEKWPIPLNLWCERAVLNHILNRLTALENPREAPLSSVATTCQMTRSDS